MTDPRTPAPALELESVELSLGGRPILREVSLAVAPHTILAVIGASGCGKTTLLRAIAGLIPVDRGLIRLGGESLAARAADRRGIVYLNQEPLLFPHLDVFENIAFGLRLRGLPRADIEPRIVELLAQLELDGLGRRAPQALSGGQRQRVAFGRALAVAPALLLLDEPFSNLDPVTRASMQDLFKRLAGERGITALFVTHDLKETLRIGESFATLRGGTLRAYRDRHEFCADPASGVSREADFWRDIARGSLG